MSKKLIVAISLLVVFAVATTLLNSKNSTQHDEKPLFLASEIGAVSKVTIKKEESEIILSKSDGGWVIENDNNFPVEASKLAKLFDELSDSKVHRRVSRSNHKHQELGLSLGTLLEFSGKGKSFLSIYLGSEREGGGQYMRFSDSDNSYLIDKKIDVSQDFSFWELKTLVDVKPEEIKSVDYGSKTVLARDKPEDKFSITGVEQEQLDQAKLTQVGQILAAMKYVERVSKTNAVASAAMEKTIATTVELFTGEKYIIESGKAGKKGEESFFVNLKMQPKNKANIESMLLDSMMGQSYFKINDATFKRIRMAKSDLLKDKKS